MENLAKIIEGLGKEAEKVAPTPMDDDAIRKSISERNTPIVVATPYAMMRFRKSKNTEEEKDQNTSAE
ncbi:hypothetical protein FUT12_26670 [Bacillus mycoides]|uniref:hypothetical protein n=1 Tax=Bacillus mycoides TaxID=1405 RepID=UPI001879906C|nr:hypothetical protein [Bacillus mycoides]MBE7151042.1 hypothetical protein [Bacillus mycoides]